MRGSPEREASRADRIRRPGCASRRRPGEEAVERVGRDQHAATRDRLERVEQTRGDPSANGPLRDSDATSDFRDRKHRLDVDALFGGSGSSGRHVADFARSSARRRPTRSEPGACSTTRLRAERDVNTKRQSANAERASCRILRICLSCRLARNRSARAISAGGSTTEGTGGSNRVTMSDDAYDGDDARRTCETCSRYRHSTVTPLEAAERLRVSPRSVRELVAAGLIRTVKIGTTKQARRRIPLAALDAFVAGREEDATDG